MSFGADITYGIDRVQFMGITKTNSSYLLIIAGSLWVIAPVVIGKIIDVFWCRLFSLTTFSMLAHAILFAICDYIPGFTGQAIVYALVAWNFIMFLSTFIAIGR